MATFAARFTEKETPLKATFNESQNLYATFGDTQIIEAGDYTALTNKPQINEVTLQGNKTLEELGDTQLTNREIKAIFDKIFNGGN